MSASVEPTRETIRWPQPGELWSVWDMIDVKLRELLEAFQRIAQMRQSFIILEDSAKAGMMNVEALGAVMGAAEYVIKIAKDADLDATLANAERLHDCVLALKMTHMQTGRIPAWNEAVRDLEHHVASTHQAIKDQLSARSALMLSAAETRLFELSESQFPELEAKFPDVRHDADEACRCLSLHRNTAAVFHLMRLMEFTVRELAARLGAVAGTAVTVLKSNGEFLEWGGLLSNMKQQGINKLTVPSDVQQWSEIHALLYTVKEAWRNPTMHPASKYTDTEAAEIFAAVKSLTRRLSALV